MKVSAGRSDSTFFRRIRDTTHYPEVRKILEYPSTASI